MTTERSRAGRAVEFDLIFKRLEIFARGYRVTPGVSPPDSPRSIEMRLRADVDIAEDVGTFNRTVACGDSSSLPPRRWKLIATRSPNMSRVRVLDYFISAFRI